MTDGTHIQKSLGSLLGTWSLEHKFNGYDAYRNAWEQLTLLLLKSLLCVLGVLFLPCVEDPELFLIPVSVCVILTSRNASISVSSLDLCCRVTLYSTRIAQTPQHSGLNSLGFLLLCSSIEINS